MSCGPRAGGCSLRAEISPTSVEQVLQGSARHAGSTARYPTPPGKPIKRSQPLTLMNKPTTTSALLAVACKIILLTGAFVSFTSFSAPPKKPPLSTIEVTYAAVACPCAQWVLDIKAPPEEREYIYLERGNQALPDADRLWDGKHLPLKFRLKGHFKPGKGLPPRYKQAKGGADPARVFQYTSLTIIERR